MIKKSGEGIEEVYSRTLFTDNYTRAQRGQIDVPGLLRQGGVAIFMKGSKRNGQHTFKASMDTPNSLQQRSTTEYEQYVSRTKEIGMN